MVIDYFTKMFLLNKAFIIVSLLALTSSTLIASSIILTNLTLNSAIESKVEELNYHLILYIYSDTEGYDQRDLVNKLNKIYGEHVLINSYINIPVELTSISGVDLRINGTPVEKGSICLLYIPRLNHTFVFATPQISMNGRKDLSSEVSYVDLTIGNHTYGSLVLIKKLDSVIRVLSEVYGVHAGSRVDLTLDYYNPFTIVFNTIYIKVPYRNESVFLLTGSQELYFNFTKSLETRGAKVISIPLTDVYYENYVPRRIEVNAPGKIVFSILILKSKEVSAGYGADYSFNKVYSFVNEVDGAIKPFRSGVLDDKVLIELSNIRRGDYQFRLSVGIALIPVLFVSFIVFIKIPTIILSLCRREIALLRVRGVSTKILYRSFILNMVIWILIGSSLSTLLAPLVVSLVNYSAVSLNQYVKLLDILFNPYYLIVINTVTLALATGGFVKSYSGIQSIELQEFLKPQFTSRSSVLGEKPSGLYIVLLIFSIYVVVRMLILNPYRVLTSYEKNPLASFLSVILLILEPLTLLFGSVILIYTIVKTLTIYPSIMSKVVSLTSRIFTRKFGSLIIRLLQLKYVYIALALIVGNFSLSLLASGVMSLDLTTDLYSRVGYAMHGGLGYILIKPTAVKDVDRLYYELNRVKDLLNKTGHEYSVGFMFLGFTNQSGLTNCFNVIPVVEKDISIHVCKAVWIEIEGRKIPISYVMFIDKGFDDVVQVVDELSYSGSMKLSLNEVVVNGGRAIYIFNRKCEEELRRTIYDHNEPYRGAAKLNVAGVRVFNIVVVDSARNIPLINAFVDAGAKYIPHFSTTLEYSGLSTLPVAAPYERGLIMSIENIDILKGYGSFGYIFILIPRSHHVHLDGYTVYPVSRTERFINDALSLMNLSHKFTLIMGLCMLTSCIIVALALSYIIVVENMKIFIVMSGRGVSARDIYVITVAEVVSISLLYLLPGVIAGLIVGYGLSLVTTQSFELTQVVPIYIDEAYGVTPNIILSKTLLLTVGVSITIPILIALAVIKLLWRKVLNQTIRLIGGL